MEYEAKNKPLASIIVRTKNRPRQLKQALKSIVKQTYRPLEIVLVNDCGEDVSNLKDYFQDYLPIKYIKLDSENGRAEAANVGLKEASGEFICFLDDDDLFYKKHVAELISVLLATEYKVAYSDTVTVWVKYNGKSRRYRKIRRTALNKAGSKDFSYERLKLENYIPLHSVLFRKEALVESGGFDSSLDFFEDWELLLRIGKNYPFYHLKQNTCEYFCRIQEFSRKLKDSYRKILKKHALPDSDDYVVELWSLMYKRNLELNRDNLRLYTQPFNRIIDFWLKLIKRF